MNEDFLISLVSLILGIIGLYVYFFKLHLIGILIISIIFIALSIFEVWVGFKNGRKKD